MLLGYIWLYMVTTRHIQITCITSILTKKNHILFTETSFYANS